MRAEASGDVLPTYEVIRTDPEDETDRAGPGWEPFAVTVEDGDYGRSDYSIWWRRQVQEP